MVVFAALIAVGGGIALWVLSSRPRLQNHRPLGGAQVDVSRNDRAQTEVTIAADPANRRVLLAGSNDELFVTRVYSTTDGGKRWTSVPGPPLASRRPCGLGDPAVAVASRGREYYAFLADLQCFADRPHLFVSTRIGSSSRWHTFAVAKPRGPRFIWDDKPAIAVDNVPRSPHFGRVYLVWSRLVTRSRRVLASSHSDDHARTWTSPIPIGPNMLEPLTSSVAVGPGGAVYVTAWDRQPVRRLRGGCR